MCRDEDVWRSVDEQDTVIQQAMQEEVVATVREVMAQEGTTTRWEIHALAARLRDVFHVRSNTLSHTLRARHGGRHPTISLPPFFSGLPKFRRWGA